ncbi:hypothetical protein [Oceaniglobus trochenteri]|uniref:hypothetical protein n=1 Tax=Oceaniglobus trochenteri TaxID=2763260 RepID=UPI001CFFA7A6|nr:hypothetical protein [Oceaniglobus trochenteri]
MSFRSSAASVLALLALGAGHAQAQSNRDNDVLIDQLGADNSAIITQSGQRNLAGSDLIPMTQDGIYNALGIFQRGLDNTVGLAAPGLSQLGRRNTTSIFNTIDIIQDSNGNTIGSVTQQSLGLVTNGANALAITQQTGDRNIVNAVRQIQESGEAAQSAVIVQTGRDNIIDRIEQRSNDTGREGPNEIEVNILGSNNGRLALSGFAGEPLVADSSVLQEADTVDPGIYGNKVVLDIIGDDNRFGIRQGGRMNDVGRLVVNGNGNQLGLRQDGTENNIQMAVIEGDGNEVGIDQIVTNTAVVDLIGQSDDNRVYVFQQGDGFAEARIEGDRNTLRVVQDYLSGNGGTNEARSSILGDDNFGNLEQLGDNLFALSITGDRNNGRASFLTDMGLSMTPGFFVQWGLRNEMDFQVTGSDNLFAARQDGDDNRLNAIITGSGNQAASSQTGDLNIATLIQTGNDNIASLTQSGRLNDALIRQN